MRPSESEVLQSNQGGKLEFVQKDRPSNESPSKEESKGTSSSSNNNNKALQEEIVLLNNKIEILTKENRDLQEKLRHQASSAAPVEKEAPAPSSNDDSAKQEIQRLRERILELENRIQLLSSELERITHVSKEKENAHLEEIQALRRNIALQEEKNQSSSTGLSEEEREKLNDQIKQLRNENENMINQRNALQEILFKHGSSVKAIL